MTKDLIIFGNTSFAEIASFYFTEDSKYNVIGFCVDDAYYESETFLSLPLYRYNDIVKNFEPKKFSIFVAITYQKLNRVRNEVLSRFVKEGFGLASYVSSDAFVHKTATLGEHTFIFENNVIQPRCTIGFNNIFWSGNHIGHHSTFGNNNFISSHCVVSGHATVGDNCFFGVNSTLADNVSISSDVWIEPTCCIKTDIHRGSVVKSQGAEISRATTFKLFKIPDAEH